MLMAGGLKDRETFQLTFSGAGPLGGIVAISDGEGGVRGYVTNGKVRERVSLMLINTAMRRTGREYVEFSKLTCK